jgi:hypothetical protein
MVFLLLGAIVNVAVAWSSLAWASVNTFDRKIVTLKQQGAYGAFVSHQPCWQQFIFWSDVALRIDNAPASKDVPQWAWTFQPKINNIERGDLYQVVEARGWPSLSMKCSYQEIRQTDIGNTAISVLGGVMPKSLIGSFNIGQELIVPVLPLWPSFAINTIFYAAMLWLLWIAPGPIRRFIRIKRHRCPACAYQIAPGTGPVCSECGAVLPWMKESRG